MPRFHYRALRQSGGEVAGELVADSPGDAASRLQSAGSLPIEITERGRTARRAWPSSGTRLPARDLIRFTRQFAALAGAGVAVDRGLALIAAGRGGGRPARLAHALLDAVTRGESLSRACAEQPGLARHYAMVIAAGEARGDIADALERLAAVLERSRAINQSLAGALVYPASILVVGCLSVSFLLAFVVPRFETLLDNFNRAPPVAMQILLAVSSLFRVCAVPGAVALAAATIFFLVRRRDAGFRLAMHRRLLALPGIGGLLGKIETERITFLLGTLLAAGVEVPAAVAATGAAMTNEALRAGLALVERGVERGDGVAGSFEAARLLPDLALELVRVGEETGDLATMLLKASDIVRSEVEATTAAMIGLIAPVSIVLLGLLIGAVALAIFGTVMEVYDIAT